MDIRLTNKSIINVYCTTSALQENLRPQLPQQFIAFVNSLNPIPNDIAITLRVNGRAGYPAATAYIQAFAHAGWQISSAALLGPSAASLRASLPNMAVAVQGNSPSLPTNETANSVRQIWGWL